MPCRQVLASGVPLRAADTLTPCLLLAHLHPWRVLFAGLILREDVKVKTLKFLMETLPRALCWGKSAVNMTTFLFLNHQMIH